MRPVIFSILAMLVLSCEPYDPSDRFPAGEVEGSSPVYQDDQSLEIVLESPTSVRRAGMIQHVGQYLLLQDINRGIHIYDNTDKTDPINQGFLRVKGLKQTAISGSSLFINQYDKLIVIDMKSINDIAISYENSDLVQMSALPARGYFECFDNDSDNRIIGWEKSILNNPRCYR